MRNVRAIIPITFLLLAPTAPAQTAPRSAHSTKPLTLAQVWAMDATYTDPRHGVTFHYPSTWKAATEYGYHPPALTYSAAKPIAGFALDEGGFPRDKAVSIYSKTNLEGFGIVYSAAPAAGAGQCKALAAQIADSQTHNSAVFAGRTFSIYETEEAGMSQSIAGLLYAAYAGGTCYLFETGTATASLDPDDGILPLTPAQRHFINAHLLAIMKSVRINPKPAQ